MGGVEGGGVGHGRGVKEVGKQVHRLKNGRCGSGGGGGGGGKKKRERK